MSRSLLSPYCRAKEVLGRRSGSFDVQRQISPPFDDSTTVCSDGGTPTLYESGRTEKQVSTAIVEALIDNGVEYVFCVPGAKINHLTDAILDSSIVPVPCQHEQNATFMAASVGRLTDKAGVCLVTSGPGASNMLTGLLSANSENVPVVAIAGDNPKRTRNKHTHQCFRAPQTFAPIVKKVFDLIDPSNAQEVIFNAFRIAEAHPQGVVFINVPCDVAGATTWVAPHLPRPLPTSAGALVTDEVVQMIESAARPVLLLGHRGHKESVALALHRLVHRFPMAIVETFQGAYGNNRRLNSSVYFGRVSLWRNQPGDYVLASADLVLAVGFDQIEYDCIKWTQGTNFKLITIDYALTDMDVDGWSPSHDLIGDIASTLRSLTLRLPLRDFERARYPRTDPWPVYHALKAHDARVHPQEFIIELEKFIDDDTIIMVDVGTVYVYVSRLLRVYKPRKLHISNGQQTLGVALPWAIAASLLRPHEKIVSISGDGGFLFSAAELRTAVKHGCNITHFVWNDSQYNMVALTQQASFGRHSFCDLGHVKFDTFAESFGATGYSMNRSNYRETMEEALNRPGVVVVDVDINYDDNAKLLSGEISI